MDPTTAKLTLIAPEMVLCFGAVVVAVLGLTRNASLRRSVPMVAALFLAVSVAACMWSYSTPAAESSGLLLPYLGSFAKPLIACVAILLVMLGGTSVDRRLEAAFESGRVPFEAVRVLRGEFHAFLLLSVAGTMLIASATDLIWLFLALELSSLPSYVMVAVGRHARKAQEAGVKYFFLGAMSSAIFLYGFALLYGATGSLQCTEIAHTLATQAATNGVSTLAIIGAVLAVLGISFKLAAVPMHFYAPDVYEGASGPVTAFLGFMPKAAGILALITVLSLLGWSGHAAVLHGQEVELQGLPAPIAAMLWMMSVLTMTLGNIGALLQRNIKRMLGYSSIAHSGYLMMGLLAGPGAGLNAVLFYLVGYGVMNTVVLAVLCSLERNGEEVETLEDIAGLRNRHPMLAWMLAIAAGSLIGLPPMIGFFGKIYLFTAVLEQGQTALVIIAAVNSAVSVFYYLQLVILPMLAHSNPRSETVTALQSPWPKLAAVIGGVCILGLAVFAQPILEAASGAFGVATVSAAAADEPTAQTTDGMKTVLLDR
ncbi:MAG: NADH-quinone oxidoreductase subunit N [Phycisphaerales bacterium]|nr:NADH-quinone oxidoreductase subunit N [Phycisphaerales bacterium]